MSARLACLADCGYTVRHEGRFVDYRVTDPHVADLVMLGRTLSANNANA